MTRRQIQSVPHSNQSINSSVCLAWPSGAEPGSYKDYIPLFIDTKDSIALPDLSLTRQSSGQNRGQSRYLPSPLPLFPPSLPNSCHNMGTTINKLSPRASWGAHCRVALDRDSLPWSPQQLAQDTLCRSISSFTIRKLRVSRPSRVTRRTAGQNTLLGGEGLHSFSHLFPLQMSVA